MRSHVIFYIVCFLLLITISAWADKGDQNRNLAQAICNDYTYNVGGSESYYFNTDVSTKTTKHIIKVNSGDSLITNLSVSLKFKTTYALVVSDTFFTEFNSMTVEQTQVGDYRYLHVVMTEVNTAFSTINWPLFEVSVTFDYCRASTDTVTIEFEDYSPEAYYNQMWTSAGYCGIGNMNDGYSTLKPPFANLTIIHSSETVGTIIDSTYRNGQIAIPVYFNSNLSYFDGFAFKMEYETRLNFDSVVTTSYSTGTTAAEDDVSNPNGVLFTLGTNSNSYPEPLTVDNLLLTAYFTLDTLAKPDSLYKVWLDSTYQFTGCADYYKSGELNSNHFLYIRSVDDSATWKFIDKSVPKGTQNFPFYFQIQTKSELYTDGPQDSHNAKFTFDKGTLDKVTYDGVSTNYSYYTLGMRWENVITGDTVSVKEHGDHPSEKIRATGINFQTVGYLNMDAGSSTGPDTVEHRIFTNERSVYYRNDNYVVVRYSGDTLFYQDGNLGLQSGVISVIQSGGGGCPTLYTWDGGGYVLENTILTHSQGKVNPQPQDDYYPVKFCAEPEEGYYKFQIREYENEITYLDDVELIAIDHPIEAGITISNSGDVFTYDQKIEPVKAIDKWGRDVLPYVGKEDDVWMDVSYPGSMVLTYPNLNYSAKPGKFKNYGSSFGLGNEPPPPKKMVTADMTDGEGDNLYAEVKDINGDWYYLGALPPREFNSENSRWVINTDELVLGETFEVRISWKVCHKVDLQALFVGRGSDFIEHKIKPAVAEHSVAGKTASLISEADDDVLTITPGENVVMKFKVPDNPVPDGYKRSFFFRSHGYYTPMKNGLLPNDYALYDNYPNPFNPSTTIRYSLPSAGEVSLIVYNVLGQKVKTLVAGNIEAGQHEIVWGGDADDGKAVASGIYFYRLKAGDYEKSKKMILIK